METWLQGRCTKGCIEEKLGRKRGLAMYNLYQGNPMAVKQLVQFSPTSKDNPQMGR
jgi:hypothetical protein